MSETPAPRSRGGIMPLIIVIGAFAVGLLVVIPVVFILGGGDPDNDSRDESPTIIDSGEVTIDIRDFTYEPGNVTVPVGATVTWVNHDSAPHDATDDEGDWNTDILSQEDEGSVTFDEPGAFDYHCSIHPYMKARLTVGD